MFGNDNNDDNSFSWDEAGVPQDFFNDSPEDIAAKTEADAVISEINKEENETNDTKEKTDEELADELFNDENDSLEEEDEEEDEEDHNDVNEENGKQKPERKSKVDKPSIVTTAQLLKEKGIIDFELGEGEELTEDDADAIIEDGFDEAVDNRLKDIFDTMPDVVKQLVKFTKDGGDPTQFISTMIKGQASGLSVGMDLKDESNQEMVMKSVLKEQGYDDDYIDIHIETLKDSNKLGTIAEKQYKAWEEKANQANQELVEAQAKKREDDKINLRKEKTRLTSTLGTLSDINGIKLNNKDKKELPSYILDKTVALKNGSTITSFQKDVWEAMGNETTALQLAKLLRNRKEDGSIDLSKIEMSVKTKVVKEIKDEVQRNKNKYTPRNSVNGSSRKELADFF